MYILFSLFYFKVLHTDTIHYICILKWVEIFIFKISFRGVRKSFIIKNKKTCFFFVFSFFTENYQHFLSSTRIVQFIKIVYNLVFEKFP